VKSTDQTVKEKIDSFVDVIQKNYGDGFTFEIVCVINPKNMDQIRSVSTLARTSSLIRVFPRDTSGLRWLVHGFIVSHGAIIVDSRFFASQIDLLQVERFSQFVIFAEPVAEFEWLTSKYFRVPIAFSRDGGNVVLSKLTLMCNGCGNELMLLCQRQRVTFEVVKVRFGLAKYSIVDAIGVVAVLLWIRAVHGEFELGQSTRDD
jgi:hypothetical protein